MPPAAAAREGDSSSSTDQSSSSTSRKIPVVAAVLCLGAILLVSFCLSVYAYRRSRLQKTKTETRLQQERDWVRGGSTSLRQDLGWEDRAWEIPGQDKREGRVAVKEVLMSGNQVEDRVPAETSSFLASPSPPPPAYTRVEIRENLR
jgi:hypothetical protein